MQYIIIKRKKLKFWYGSSLRYYMRLFGSLCLITCRVLVWRLGTKASFSLLMTSFLIKSPSFAIYLPHQSCFTRTAPHRQTLLRNYAKYKFTVNNEYSCISAVLTAANHTCWRLRYMSKVNLYLEQSFMAMGHVREEKKNKEL